MTPTCLPSKGYALYENVTGRLGQFRLGQTPNLYHKGRTYRNTSRFAKTAGERRPQAPAGEGRCRGTNTRLKQRRGTPARGTEGRGCSGCSSCRPLLDGGSI